jgi:hypothetical protein
MATEAQVEANRANAQKSTGPRTPEGKAAIARNAVKHGLRARAAVLQGEDWEEYTCFREGMLEELDPDGLQARGLAARIVDLTWRLRRAGRYQDAVFEALYDKYAAEPTAAGAGPDLGTSVSSGRVLGRMLLADFSGERVLERAQQYERRIESSLSRAWADLRQLRCQLRLAAPRRTASGAGWREDSGGQNRVSPSASADSARETANSVLPAEEPLCQTNPICPGTRGQGPGAGNLKPDPRPLSPVLSCQTKPILEAVSSLRGQGSNADRPGRAWDLLDQACERQPVWTGVRRPAGLVQAGERRRTSKR